MPKLKTHSGSKKRFRLTSKGKVKAKQSFTSHMMRNKPQSMKRKARGNSILSAVDTRIIIRNFIFGVRRKKKG